MVTGELNSRKYQPKLFPCASATTRSGYVHDFVSTYLSRVSGCFFGLVSIRLLTQKFFYDWYIATDFGFYTVLANTSRVVFIIILMAIFSRVPFTPKRQHILGWVSAGALTVTSALLLIAPEVPLIDLPLIAYLLAAFGIAWIGGMWIQFFVRLDAKEAFLYAFLCLGFSSALGFFFGLLPTETVDIICIILPAVGVLSYEQSMETLDMRSDFIAEPARDDTYDRQPFAAVVPLIAGAAIFQFAVGMARGLPYGDSIPLSVGFQAIHQFGVLALSIGVVLAVVMFKRGVTFRGIWVAEVSGSIFSVILIATLDPVATAWGATLLTIASTLMVGVFWYCAVDYSRHSLRKAYLILGFIWIIRLLPRELGRQCIFLMGPEVHMSIILAGVLVFVFVLSLVCVVGQNQLLVRPLMASFPKESYSQKVRNRMARLQHSESKSEPEPQLSQSIGETAMAHDMRPALNDDAARSSWEKATWIPGVVPVEEPIPEKDEAAAALETDAPVETESPEEHQSAAVATDEPQAASEEDALQASCKRLQEQFNLTDRETDMAFYIACGYSRAATAKKLFISENTVKSYTRGLYQKLGIHSKQELVDRLHEE